MRSRQGESTPQKLSIVMWAVSDHATLFKEGGYAINGTLAWRFERGLMHCITPPPTYS